MTSVASPARPRLPAGLALVMRFAMAGVINTAVGLAITLALDIGFKVSPALSNAAGYAVGIVISWTLQRRFVFRTQNSGWRAKGKYLTTMAIAFAVNQGVLAAIPHFIGTEPLARSIAQVVAMGSYTVTQFLLFRLWVFRKPAADAQG